MQLLRAKTLLAIVIALLAINGFAQQTTVAVLPSDGDANFFDYDDLEALTSKIRNVALKTLPPETFAVLTQEIVIRRLGGAENYIKECRESTCIVDLGKKAQVDYITQASVGKLRNKMRLKVDLYEVASSKLIGTYDGDGEYFDDYFVLLKAIDENMPNTFKKIPEANPSYYSKFLGIFSRSEKNVTPTEPIVQNNKEKVQNLIKKGLNKNKEKILEESIYLSPADREFLYNEMKKKSVLSNKK